MPRQVPDSGQPFRCARARRLRGRTGLIALVVAVLCALLGGVAAFASARGRTAARPFAASSPGSDRPGRLPSPAAAGGPAAAASRRADPFSPAMTAYLSGRAGTVTAAVYDMRTGQTWTLGHGPPQAAASVVKVDILETLLAARPAGLSAADRALAGSMIDRSDNDAATTLWNAAGGPAALQSYNLSAGLVRTTPSLCLACADFPWPGWGLTTTTPADQVLLLRQLFDGALLSPADRRYAMSLMENVEPGQRWGVSAGVPAGVRIALKNGWVPLTAPNANWQINSEGWICGDGRNYLVAVLAAGNPSEQYGISTIDALSALLWPAMGSTARMSPGQGAETDLPGG